jgi:hypothetical protein
METVSTVKQINKIFKKFGELWNAVKNDQPKFDEITKLYCTAIINKTELEHIPFYVDEYYTKVAAVFDTVDTIFFGKLRTPTQLLIHDTYISTTIKGAFLASAYNNEQDLPLSYCSYEGLKLKLKYTKVTLLSYFVFFLNYEMYFSISD